MSVVEIAAKAVAPSGTPEAFCFPGAVPCLPALAAGQAGFGEDPVSWRTASSGLSLAPGESHIWRFSLDCSAESLVLLASSLSPEEEARAARYVFAEDRRHFIAARGMLRLLLGRYLDSSPADLAFRLGQQGKPSLDPRCVNSTLGQDLRFNLSHSHGMALYAFALGREVGVDLEKHRPDFASAEIAERFFSSREREELLSLSPELRTAGFFHCWTRKEAYVKVRGEGLHIPLDSFDVTLTPGMPAGLRSEDSGRWSLFSFCPAAGYSAAAIVETGARTLLFCDVRGEHATRELSISCRNSA